MGLGRVLWGGPVEVLLVEILGDMDVVLPVVLFVVLPVVGREGQAVVQWG